MKKSSPPGPVFGEGIREALARLHQVRRSPAKIGRAQ